MKSKLVQITLLVIIILAAFLRFWQLGNFPAINADEAAIGYNAWSLIETGVDEHGNLWPIHFASFNDFKPGLTFYIVMPFVKLFGLNNWAIRFPGAMFGVATVLVVYFLVKELLKMRNAKGETRNEITALTAALFLAISPWHIHFSRGIWEVNIATFFITTGVWLFIKSTNNPKYFILSALAFVLSLYTYHSARVVVPLLVFGLFAIYAKKLQKNWKQIVIAGSVGTLLLLPLGVDLAKGQVFSRAAGVGLFADSGPVERVNEQRSQHTDFQGLPALVLHNKGINFSLAFLENWGEHYWGEFLFLTGDKIERNRVPETGQMYLFDILFVIAGLVGIVNLLVNRSHPGTKRSEVIGSSKNEILSAFSLQNDTRGIYVILLWLLIAPIAAALTFQSPHALRSQNMVIPLVIISAYGLVSLSYFLHTKIKDKRLLDLVFVLFIAFVAWNFTRYLHMYWVHMAREFPFSSQYGVKELVEYVEGNGKDYKKIIVTDTYDQPYILFLYYLQYPPEKFQAGNELTVPDEYGFSTVRSFDKYEFRSIDGKKDIEENPNALIIGTPEEIPDENVSKEIYGSNGYKYFDIVVN